MKKILVFICALMLVATPLFAASDTEQVVDFRNADVVYLGSSVSATGNVVTSTELPAEVSTAVQSWVVAAGADTSCATTCGIANPLLAMDATTGAFVATDSATADSCICDGAVA